MVSEDNKKVEKKQLEKSEVKPWRLAKKEIIGDFFDANMKYIENLRNQILNDNKAYPYIQLKLVDIMVFNERLYSYIKKNIESAIEDICEVLHSKVKLNNDVNEFLKKIEICRFEEINLSFDLEEIREDIPLYDNFSLGTKAYVGKLTRITARFLDLKIFRENVATVITYQCLVCKTNFQMIQFKGRKGKYKVPRFCINPRCKAKSYGDFRVENIEKYHEMGAFRIGEIDFSKQNEKECYTFLNFNYFSEKAQNINLNDVIEIIGIIKLDFSEIGTRKEDQKIYEFVKVIDFNPIELKTTDPDIIKKLYQSFDEDQNYHHQILDSIHPLTKGIYTFQIFKLLTLLSIISSNSWDTIIKNRCSINYITGSVPSLFKGSIVSEFRRTLGANNVGRISGQDNTPKAFIPTSQRGKDSNFQIRYGAFAYNNKKFLVIDESQHMLGSKELRQPIKYLEDGYIDRGSDGTVLHAEAKLSVGFLMNYINEEQNEGYDYNSTLRANLCGIEESTLQRIDLHYTIPNLPVQIMNLLERRMFRKNDGDIDVDVVYNYIKEAKRIFPMQKIPKLMENKLIEYIKLLRTIRGIKRQNIREFRTLVRLICGISAIRLKTEVDESDLEYLQKHLVNLMIPFFECDKIRELKAKQIDMNEVYQNTIKLLIEIREIIPIHVHISLIRRFLEDHYFPNPDTAKINEYMPSETGLNKNQKYRTLLENKENIAFVDRIGYVIGKKDNKKHYFEKKWVYQVILNDLREIYHDNENSPCEKESLIQGLEFKTDFDRTIIDRALNFHIQNKNLIKTKDNLLKLDGVGWGN
ncbi:MAG: hypothetical protein ACTSQJ_01795 [Promethearchaeota archaeon]